MTYVFHAYWTGELLTQHLISITTCWHFNVQGWANRKIYLWVNNLPDNKIKAEISKFAEIIEYDYDAEIKETPFENRGFYANKRPAYFSDIVR